jgi:hypothetical protein
VLLALAAAPAAAPGGLSGGECECLLFCCAFFLPRSLQLCLFMQAEVECVAGVCCCMLCVVLLVLLVGGCLVSEVVNIALALTTLRATLAAGCAR